MKVGAGLALLLLNVRLSCSCYGDGHVLFCPDVPPAFRPGYTSLVMVLKHVGEINSTVLRSDSLASVTRLRIEDAGVTGVAGGAFGSFQNLTNLSLNQNLLTEIKPSWFGRPDILRELNLTGNQIQVLRPSSLHGLVHLTRLRLNKNNIRTIDPNSFSSNTILSELDLSENRMTRVSPQVFGSLRSTRFRLDGNPWDCSCGAEHFVDFLKDLQSRSLLDRQAEVTCASPPSLRGRPAWNVTVCVTPPPPPPPPPAVTQTVHPKPTDALTIPTAPSQTGTSGQSKPSDAPTVISSLFAAPPVQPTSDTKTSVQPKPTNILPAATAYVSPPPPVTEISVHPKPSDPPTTTSAPTGMTGTTAASQPSSDTNNVCTLVAVIAVLSSLLFVVCLLAVLHRRKRSSKAVIPEENRSELKDDGSISSQARSPGPSEERENNHWASEKGRGRSFAGVRAKSADAILFTSPFCATVTLQTEREALSEKQRKESEVARGTEIENVTNTSAVNAKRAADGGNPDENSYCGPVADTVPYLSIGTTRNKPDPDDGPGQRSQTVKVRGRVSTWPPTAVQWQERCKMKEEEEEGSDVFTVLKVMFNEVEPPSGSDRDRQDLSQTSSLTEAAVKQEEQLQEEEMIQDQNLDQDQLSQNQDQKPAHKKPNQISSTAEQRDEPKRAATSRRRAQNRSTGSKAPPGGASPDDETLLPGHEYAFMDLLHEVVQNNGRWTRERWRQIHVNKQRRLDRGTEELNCS